MFPGVARIIREALRRGRREASRPGEAWPGAQAPGATTLHPSPALPHRRRPNPGPVEELEMMAPVQTEAKPQVSRSQALGWLRQMLLIRRFEERAAMLYQNQLIGGFCHLYSGQEPTAVGSIGV